MRVARDLRGPRTRLARAGAACPPCARGRVRADDGRLALGGAEGRGPRAGTAGSREIPPAARSAGRRCDPHALPDARIGRSSRRLSRHGPFGPRSPATPPVARDWPRGRAAGVGCGPSALGLARARGPARPLLAARSVDVGAACAHGRRPRRDLPSPPRRGHGRRRASRPRAPRRVALRDGRDSRAATRRPSASPVCAANSAACAPIRGLRAVREGRRRGQALERARRRARSRAPAAPAAGLEASAKRRAMTRIAPKTGAGPHFASGWHRDGLRAAALAGPATPGRSWPVPVEPAARGKRGGRERMAGGAADLARGAGARRAPGRLPSPARCRARRRGAVGMGRAAQPRTARAGAAGRRARAGGVGVASGGRSGERRGAEDGGEGGTIRYTTTK